MERKAVSGIMLTLLFTSMLTLVSTIGIGAASSLTNYALSFDGQNDIVKVLDSDSLDLVGAGTIEVWIKHPGTWGVHTIISKAPALNNMGYNNYFMKVTNADQLMVGIGAGAGIWNWIAADNVVPVNVWMHAAFTWNGASLKLYKDGIEIGSRSQTIVPTVNDKPLFIGAESCTSPPTYFFQGLIDEVRIWKVARSQQEIEGSMNIPLIGNETGLVAYWRFDEGSGQSALDATANHNDGQLGSTSGSDPDDPTWVVSDAPLNYQPIFASMATHGSTIDVYLQNTYPGAISVSTTATADGTPLTPTLPGPYTVPPCSGSTPGVYIAKFYAPPTKGTYDVTVEANYNFIGQAVSDTFARGLLAPSVDGDVNNDATVNIFDAIHLCTHYGLEPWVWPEDDVNADNYIEILDAVIIMVHFGQTDP